MNSSHLSASIENPRSRDRAGKTLNIQTAAAGGFTLIEMMVVIAVIALLVGLLLPALGRSRESGKQSICLSNTRILALATVMYAHNDKNESFLGYNAALGDRKKLLYPYIADGKTNADTKVESVWTCPNTQAFDAMGKPAEAGYGFNSSFNFKPIRIIAKPSETVCVGDGGRNPAGAPLLSTHLMAPSKAGAGICRPNPRHMGNPNIGWIDGHAELMEMVEPFYPKDPSKWGNGINDPANAQYTDEMWDIY